MKDVSVAEEHALEGRSVEGISPERWEELLADKVGEHCKVVIPSSVVDIENHIKAYTVEGKPVPLPGKSVAGSYDAIKGIFKGVVPEKGQHLVCLTPINIYGARVFNVLAFFDIELLTRAESGGLIIDFDIEENYRNRQPAN